MATVGLLQHSQWVMHTLSSPPSAPLSVENRLSNSSLHVHLTQCETCPWTHVHLTGICGKPDVKLITPCTPHWKTSHWTHVHLTRKTAIELMYTSLEKQPSAHHSIHTSQEKQLPNLATELIINLFVMYTQPLSQNLFNHSCPTNSLLMTVDTQLHKSCSPEHYDNVRNSLQTCIPDIKDWMTENKLQLDAHKTETLLFNSSKLKHPPASLSICQATIFFSQSGTLVST